MSHCCNLVEMVHCLSMTYRHVVGDTFFSILKREQAQSLKTEGRLCCDTTSSSYCESFVVLSSQRVKAAIIGVGQKGWPVAKTSDDALIVCKRSNKKKKRQAQQVGVTVCILHLLLVKCSRQRHIHP